MNLKNHTITSTNPKKKHALSYLNFRWDSKTRYENEIFLSLRTLLHSYTHFELLTVNNWQCVSFFLNFHKLLDELISFFFLICCCCFVCFYFSITFFFYLQCQSYHRQQQNDWTTTHFHKSTVNLFYLFFLFYCCSIIIGSIRHAFLFFGCWVVGFDVDLRLHNS